MQYTPIQCKSGINKINKSRLPYDYDLNIYRGCFHGCKYCYAMYSHQYLNDKSDFFNEVFYKENIIEILEKELASSRWQKHIINLGSVSDSYQAIEKDLKLTRGVLELMLKYKNPIIISTKSTLVLRDIDLLKELSNVTYVSVSLTITSASDKFNSLFEPNASSFIDRIKTLKILKENGIRVGLHIMPVIPYLSSNIKSIELIFKYAKEIGVDHVIVGMLNLRGLTKKYFLNFIKQELPQYYMSLYEYFNDKNIKREFDNNFYKQVKELLIKYDLNNNYMRDIKEYEKKKKQFSIFDY